MYALAVVERTTTILFHKFLCINMLLTLDAIIELCFIPALLSLVMYSCIQPVNRLSTLVTSCSFCHIHDNVIYLYNCFGICNNIKIT